MLGNLPDTARAEDDDARVGDDRLHLAVRRRHQRAADRRARAAAVARQLHLHLRRHVVGDAAARLLRRRRHHNLVHHPALAHIGVLRADWLPRVES